MASPKILVVDDDPLQLEVIMNIVEQEAPNYEIMQASDGKFALAIAKNELPDIIITDWEMPLMSGIELTKELKKNPTTKDIPVIMCSGVMITSAHLKTALEAGASDYIRKPVDPIELVARMRSMIELSDSYKKIKLLNESKNEILSVIAHDLRGPVANLNQAVKMALSHKLEGDFLREFMSMLEPQIHANYNLLNNLLLWARNLRNNIGFQPEHFELQHLAEETLQLHQVKATEKEIKLCNNIPENIQLYADKNMISTILRNLIANALKFTPRTGTIQVNAHVEKTNIQLCVQDSGVGMSENDLHQILHTTTNFSKNGTEHEKGTGLGLLLCKSFIEKHNSQLKVESKLGEGSTFSFTLPYSTS